MSVPKDGNTNSSPTQIAKQAHQKRTDEKSRPNLVAYLQSFPRGVDLEDEVFARNPAPSRDVDFGPD